MLSFQELFGKRSSPHPSRERRLSPGAVLLAGVIFALALFLFATPFSGAQASPALVSDYPYSYPSPTPTPTEPPFKLIPSDITVSAGDVFQLELWTNAPVGQPISGVQVFIRFDTAFLEVVDADANASGVQIDPDTTYLDQVLLNEVDNGAGRIDYSAGALGQAPTGSFPLATITFRALASTGVEPTTVAFETAAPRDSQAAYAGAPVYGTLVPADVTIAQAVVLKGVVELEGSARPDPAGWEVPISVAIYDMDGGGPPLALCETTAQRTGLGAEFQCFFEGLAPGLYRVAVSSEHTLTNVRRALYLDAAPTPPIPFGVLLEGDANGNGVVDILDFTLLASNFLASQGDPNFNPDTDFDRTGRVDILDFTLLANNFLLTSPIDVTPPPTPMTAQTALAENNNLVVKVWGRMDRPGLVYVEYGADGVGRFRTRPVASDGAYYMVYVPRLRAETEYQYQVFGLKPPPDLGAPGQAATAALDSTPEEVGAGPMGSFTSGPLPAGLQEASFRVVESGPPTRDLTFMDFVTASPPAQSPFQGYVAIDSEGYIVWYLDRMGEFTASPMQKRDNGNIIYIANAHPGTAGYAVREVTFLGDLVSEGLSPCPSNGPFHHEVQILPPGDRIMILSRDIQDSFNDPNRLQEGDTVVIWDQSTGELTTVWNVFDFVDPTTDRTPDSDLTTGVPMWKGCSGDEPAEDWTHGNAVTAGPSGYLFSARHLDQLISISPDFQSINWRLGGPGGDFTFPDPSDKFYHQHSGWELPVDDALVQDLGLEGDASRYTRVLLFDNGNGRPEAEGGQYSRALELLLDLQDMTATKIWEYRNTPDLFAGCCSNVTRLANGNTVVVFGSDFANDVCCRTFTIVEADPDGMPVWKVELSSPGKGITYRVYPYESIMGEKRLP